MNDIENVNERIDELNKKINDLNDLVHKFITKYSGEKFYADCDTVGLINADSNQCENINTNKADIADNRTGIEETFESSLTNADDIADVRTALEEVYELINTEEE